MSLSSNQQQNFVWSQLGILFDLIQVIVMSKGHIHNDEKCDSQMSKKKERNNPKNRNADKKLNIKEEGGI